jgi:hypothetical protein
MSEDLETVQEYPPKESETLSKLRLDLEQLQREYQALKLQKRFQEQMRLALT